MASTILHHNVALFQLNGFSIVKLQPYLALQHYSVINCRSLMHSRVRGFEVI